MMRLTGIVTAFAALALALTPMTQALAAPKAPAVEITKEQRAKGMAAAPDLITAGAYDCKLADARLLGEAADAKSKVKSQFFELACTGNEGLIVVKKSDDPKPQNFTCAQAAEPGPDGKPNSTHCALPGNLDPYAGLAPYIAKAGTSCTPTKVRALGQSATNSLFELVCAESPGGYILQISSPPRLDQPAAMNPCIGYPETSNLKCVLTDRAAQIAIVDGLMAKSGKPCTIKDRAYVGVTASGASFYEVACADGKGYMIEQTAKGAFDKAIDCTVADAIAGGCKLTDARQAKTEQAGLYTKLARSSGFACDVGGYAPLPSADSTREVIELACKNRADGAIGIFGATSAGSQIFNCAHSELKGYRCSLSKAAAAYPSLTGDLTGLGKKSCTVSNARTVGVSADGHGYIEVACSDGLQGYMIEYVVASMTPKSTIICNEARGISGGCSLPGNTAKK